MALLLHASLRYLTYYTVSPGIISGPDRLKFYLLKSTSLNVGKHCELFVVGNFLPPLD